MQTFGKSGQIAVVKAEKPDALIPLLDAIDLVLDPDVFIAMRTGKASQQEQAAIEKIDTALKASPGLSKPLTLYKGYEGFPKLRDGGELAEKAFFVGSTEAPKPGDHVTVALTVLAGTPALRLNDDTYILDRSLTLSLTPAKTGPVSATMVTGPPGIKLNGEWGTVLPVHGDWGTAVIEEFFNPFHAKDGRFAKGSGGGGGGAKDPLAAKTPEQEARRAKVIKIMAGVAAAVIVVGAVGLVLSGGKPPQPKADGQPGHKGEEKSKSLEKELQDKLASKEKHRAEAERWVDGHRAKARRKADLEDDAKAKARDLKWDKDQKEKEAEWNDPVKKQQQIDKIRADMAAKEAARKRVEDEDKANIEAHKNDPAEQANYARGKEVIAASRAKESELEGHEAQSIKDYVVHPFINSRLRGEKPMEPESQEHLDSLDSAFAKASVPAGGVTLHRGLKMNDELAALKPGDTLVSDGFVSTSVYAPEARKFARGYGLDVNEETVSVEMTIKTQDDTPVVYGSNSHQELITNRGSAVNIISIEHCPDGICRIAAEAL